MYSQLNPLKGGTKTSGGAAGVSGGTAGTKFQGGIGSGYGPGGGGGGGGFYGGGMIIKYSVFIWYNLW